MWTAILGAGYVGLVSGACFAEFETEVCVVDTDADRVAALRAGRVPIYEPGLDKMVAENVADGRLSFTTDLGAALRGAEAVTRISISAGPPPSDTSRAGRRRPGRPAPARRP